MYSLRDFSDICVAENENHILYRFADFHRRSTFFSDILLISRFVFSQVVSLEFTFEVFTSKNITLNIFYALYFASKQWK